MPKIHFDPPVLGRKDIPAVLWIFASSLGFIAVFAAFMKQTYDPNVPYWKELVNWLLIWSAGSTISYFVVRPLRGLPPLFRKRETDDFETWLTGNGWRWSRLRERYTTNELILLFGTIGVLLFACFLWTTKM
jgi:hypothetical protein